MTERRYTDGDETIYEYRSDIDIASIAKALDAQIISEKIDTAWAEVTPRRKALLEAADLIDGDRDDQYGHPSVNLGNTAALMRVVFPEREWSASDIARVGIIFKLARSVRGYKRDTGVDLAGWSGLYVELGEAE